MIPNGYKPLPGPMLSQIYADLRVFRHMASLAHKTLICMSSLYLVWTLLRSMGVRCLAGRDVVNGYTDKIRRVHKAR